MPKVKGKRANFRKPCKSLKIFDGCLTYKGKRMGIFGSDRKLSVPQQHSVLP